MNIPSDKRAEIEAAIQAGRTIEAIKLYRACTGAGLKEAKDAIDAWAAGGSPPAVPVSGGSSLPPDKMRAVREALARGNKIEAIRLYREMTNCGLAEAKDAVDALPRNDDRNSPDSGRTRASAPGVQKQGCFGLLLLGGLVLASLLFGR